MSEWQVMDSAPKDKLILGYSEKDALYAVIYWDEDLIKVGAPSCWAFTNSFATDAFEPTHWMLLPEIPRKSI